jgi:hypothetical protein
VQPWGVAFDSGGNLYVADAKGRVVDVFGSSNLLVTQIGSGVLPEEYTRSVGVADATGDVYVGESFADEVFVFKPNVVGSPEAGYTLLSGTRGFGGGFTYVGVDNHSSGPADPRAGDVYVLFSKEEVIRVLAIKPDGEGQLEEAGEPLPAPAGGFSFGDSGPAVDNETGEVFVANPSSRVVDEFNNKGEPAGELSGVGTPAGSFDPVAVAVDESSGAGKGELYVVDAEHKLVDEFSAEGKYVGQIKETGPGEGFGEPLGVAVQDSGAGAGDVYVTDGSKRVVDVFGPDVLSSEPVVVTEPPSGVGLSAATLNGTVDPEGEEAGYFYEYGPCGTPATCSSSPYPSKTPEATVGGKGETTPVPVPTIVGSLSPRTSYHARLIAMNKSTPRVPGTEVTFTTSGPPILGEQYPTSVGTSTATLNGEVNPESTPNQWLTGEYHFEYGAGSVTEHETPSQPLPLVPAEEKEEGGKPVVIPAHQGPTTATGPITGLAPNTIYHYRIIVTDPDGTTTGEEHTVTTYPPTSSALPDDRAYEMVTPPNNENSNVYAPGASGAYTEDEGVQTSLPFQAAVDGNAVAYVGDPTSEGNGSAGFGGGNEFLARREGPDDWTSQDIQPPGYVTPTYQAFTADLSAGVLNACDQDHPPLAAGAPGGGYSVLYTRAFGREGYRPLFTTAPRDQSFNDFGASGIHSYFETCHPGGTLFAAAYAGASADFSHLLFEVNGALTPEASDGGGANNLYDSVGGHVSLVNVLPDGQADVNATFGASPVIAGQIPDFSHVISSDGSRVFWTDLNVSGGDPGDLYMRVNSETTVLISKGARFWTATPDGTHVFYTKEGDLYEYDTLSATATDLTPQAPVHGGVQGVIGTSEDGGYVYFVAAEGFYLSHAGAVTLIAPAGREQMPPFANTEIRGGDWQPGLGNRTAEVTSDGGGVVFMSTLSLTGYDSRGLSEVFVYDAGSGVLSCVSCNPSGEPPSEGPTEKNGGTAGFLPISHSNTYVPRWVSGGGDRVFFDSTVPLVPGDRNGRQDVYEWERAGVVGGSCPSGAAGGGCVFLLSGGSSGTASWLLDASESGGDVFIATRAELLGQDRNENYDVYDVSVGGVSGGPVGVGCVGAGCQGAPLAAPLFGVPASGTFEGVGNFSAGAGVAGEPVVLKPGGVVFSRARRLAAALRVCRRERVHRRRLVCEAAARRRFGPARRVAGKARG